MPPLGRGLVRWGPAADAAWEAVIGLGVCMAIGYWLDRKLGTSPGFFFGFLAAGLFIGFRRLLRAANQAHSTSAEEDPSKPQKSADPGRKNLD